MKKLRNLILFLFLLTAVSPAMGQVLPRPIAIDVPSCLHPENKQDSLMFPRSHRRFDVLYRKLTDLFQTGQGRVNVLHIGGSHVQAGFFSHRVRSHLADLGTSTIGGRGLLFPFAAMKTNAPKNYSFTHTGTWTSQRCVKHDGTWALGLSGACVTTRDTSATLTLALCDIARWPATQFRLLGDAETSSVVPFLICGADTISALPFDGKPGWCFPLMPADTCTFAFRGILQDSLGIRIRGVIPEGNRTGITYTESGVNGAAVPSWLDCTKFQEELSLLPPDLVIFGIGINDANVPPLKFDPSAFKDNYKQLIARIREVNPECCFVFITNNDCWLNVRGYKKRFNPNTSKVQHAMKELAREYDGAVFDVYALMGGKGSSSAWIRAGLQRRDHIHFTSAGYELWGDLLYNALVNDYLESR